MKKHCEKTNIKQNAQIVYRMHTSLTKCMLLIFGLVCSYNALHTKHFRLPYIIYGLTFHCSTPLFKHKLLKSILPCVGFKTSNNEQ